MKSSCALVSVLPFESFLLQWLKSKVPRSSSSSGEMREDTSPKGTASHLGWGRCLLMGLPSSAEFDN